MSLSSDEILHFFLMAEAVDACRDQLPAFSQPVPNQNNVFLGGSFALKFTVGGVEGGGEILKNASDS